MFNIVYKMFYIFHITVVAMHTSLIIVSLDNIYNSFSIQEIDISQDTRKDCKTCKLTDR